MKKILIYSIVFFFLFGFCRGQGQNFVWKEAPANISSEFVFDSAWHEIELTKWTSTNARAVILSIRAHGGDSGFQFFTRRRGGTIYFEGALEGRADLAGMIIQGVDYLQGIEYLGGKSEMTIAVIKLVGYVESEGVAVR